MLHVSIKGLFMNKLVIIGNGFDLAHGLKTSYKDFILWHIDTVFQLPIGKRTSELITIDSNLSYFDISSTVDYYKAKEYNDRRFWFKIKGQHIFIDNILESIEQFNWVDIERRYYARLLVLHSLTNTPENTKLEMVGELNKFMDILKKELSTYLGLQFEKGIYEVLEIRDHFNDILNSCDSDGRKFSFNVLNFNYTNTAEIYLDRMHLNYIHGELNNLQNPVIFGYGDEMDENYSKIEKLNRNIYLKHMKSFAYLQTPNYQKLFEFLDSDNFFDVYIMGHSCGLSDRLLFTHIFEHSKFNSVNIFYYQKSETENDFFEKTQNLSRYFRLESKHKMRTKVIPFSKSKPLTSYKPQTN